MSTSKCKCQVCLYYKQYVKHAENLTPEQRVFFDEMYHRLCNQENDTDVHRAILEGTWPGAVGILYTALGKALSNPHF